MRSRSLTNATALSGCDLLQGCSSLAAFSLLPFAKPLVQAWLLGHVGLSSGSSLDVFACRVRTA